MKFNGILSKKNISDENGFGLDSFKLRKLLVQMTINVIEMFADLISFDATPLKFDDGINTMHMYS